MLLIPDICRPEIAGKTLVISRFKWNLQLIGLIKGNTGNTSTPTSNYQSNPEIYWHIEPMQSGSAYCTSELLKVAKNLSF